MTPEPAVKRSNPRSDLIARIFLIAIAIAIVVGLLVFANLAQPVQLADVAPELDQSPYISSFVLTVAGPVDQGSVPLHLTAALTNAASFATAIELDIQPTGQSRGQQSACRLGPDSFSCSADLNLTSAQTFDFQLISASDGTMIATGILRVQLESFPSGSQFAVDIITGLGTLAAVLELWRFVASLRLARKDTAPETALSRRPGGPNAVEE